MENNNSLLQVVWSWIEKWAPGISYVLVAILGYFAPALINRLTGKDRAEVRSIEQKTQNDAETAQAEAMRSVVSASGEMVELSTKVIDGLKMLHKAELDERDARYARREKEFELMRKQDRKEFEKINAELRAASEKIERQNVKLREQLEQVRNRLMLKTREADTWYKQIIDDHHGTPKRVPITTEGNK